MLCPEVWALVVPREEELAGAAGLAWASPLFRGRAWVRRPLLSVGPRGRRTEGAERIGEEAGAPGAAGFSREWKSPMVPRASLCCGAGQLMVPHVSVRGSVLGLAPNGGSRRA